MQVIFFSSSHLPHPTGNGNSVLTEALIQCFLQLGFQVTVVPVQLQYDNQAVEQQHVDYLETHGVPVRYFDAIARPRASQSKWQTLRRLAWPLPDDYFHQHISLKPELSAFLNDIASNSEPTVLVSYHWPAVVLTSNLVPKQKHFLKLACIVDPMDQLPLFQRRLDRSAQNAHPTRAVINNALARKRGPYANRTLQEMDVVIQHAFHHAEELRHSGYDNVHYIPHPLPTRPRIQKPEQETVTILISGSLKGAASRHGFVLFLDHLLPELKRRENELNSPIRFRIVGHGKMPETLKSRLVAEPWVDFIGFVDSIESEYEQADMILVNIPVNLGFRTRIAEAFSYGLCVVTHAANAEGMPEIRDGENALSHEKPQEIVARLIQAVNSPDLRNRLGRAAQQTFESEISRDVAVHKLARILETKGFLPAASPPATGSTE